MARGASVVEFLAVASFSSSTSCFSFLSSFSKCDNDFVVVEVSTTVFQCRPDTLQSNLLLFILTFKMCFTNCALERPRC